VVVRAHVCQPPALTVRNASALAAARLGGGGAGAVGASASCPHPITEIRSDEASTAAGYRIAVTSVGRPDVDPDVEDRHDRRA
jgi:hypothetical protein